MSKPPLRNSPTGLSTFRDICPRKWAYKKIFKVKKEPNKFAALGSRCHDDVWDPYLRVGKLPDLATEEGQIVQPSLVHLPLPKIAVVEGMISLPFEQGEIIGKIDVHVPPDKRFPEEEEWYGPLDGVPLTIDHKTTSDFKWAMTPKALRDDIQATVYAFWVAAHYGAKEFVDLLWGYARTRKPYKAHPVRARLPVVEIERNMKDLLAVDNLMRDIYNNVQDPKEVPYEASGCSAFGGCPYISQCALKPSERMVSFMAQEQTLAEKIADRKAETAAAAKEPEVLPAAAVASPIPPPETAPAPVKPKAKAKLKTAAPVVDAEILKVALANQTKILETQTKVLEILEALVVLAAG